MANPLISVIVVAYNTGPYIRQCLDSLVHQTLDDMEIIVVESSSTDDTGVISDEYAERHLGKVRVVHTPKLGLGIARNTGMENAQGEYIGFVDSDDWVEEDMYERLLRNAITNNSDLVICDYRVHHNNALNGKYGMITRNIAMITAFSRNLSHLHVSGVEGANTEELRESLVRSGIGAVWNKLFHKDLIQGRRFPEDIVPEDIEFTISCAVDAKRLSHVSRPLYHYRQRETSAMGDMRGLRRNNLQFFESMSHSLDHVQNRNPSLLEPMYDRAAMLLFSGKIGIVHSLKDPDERRDAASKWVEMLNRTVPEWYERRPVRDWTLEVRALKELVILYREGKIDSRYDELLQAINTRPYRLAIAMLKKVRGRF